MKSNLKTVVIVLCVLFVFVFAGCSDPNNSSSSQEQIPAGFVKVAGTTVTGSNNFSSTNEGTTYYGAFIAGRNVTISTFYICDHEVTQAEYQAVMGSNPSQFNSNPVTGEVQTKRPVEKVSWYDALVYCNKKSIADGFTPCYTINNSTNPEAWGNIPTTNSNATWDAVTCNWEANGYSCLRKLNGNMPHAVEARFLPINTVVRTVSPERCRIMPGISKTPSMVTNMCLMRLKRRMPIRSKSTT